MVVQTVVVSPEVAEGEEHGEGLLHAEEAVEGPFTVELHHWLVAGEADGGDDVLAGVVAFGGAGPEQEAEVEREGGGVGGEAVFGFADLGERRGKKKLVGSMEGGEEGRGTDLDALLKFGESITHACVDRRGGEQDEEKKEQGRAGPFSKERGSYRHRESCYSRTKQPICLYKNSKERNENENHKTPPTDCSK